LQLYTSESLKLSARVKVDEFLIGGQKSNQRGFGINSKKMLLKQLRAKSQKKEWVAFVLCNIVLMSIFGRNIYI
jgi:hypothetical protein